MTAKKKDSDTKTKTAAAISAVMSYIRQEEDLAMQTMPAREHSGRTGSASANPWAISGRQTTMQTRAMMQMRTFH